MSIDRRKVIGLFAASAATALAGCGGGGADAPTRLMWVLNLNEQFQSVDVNFASARAATAVKFQKLSTSFEAEYAIYSVGMRETPPGTGALDFPGVRVDGSSSPVLVFYRWGGTSARLGTYPSGIVNYFDSTVPLTIEVYDGAGNLQQSQTLGFEVSTAQTSTSLSCRVRVRNSSNGVLVYDSGVVQRTGAIIVHPLDATGLVGVVGLNYSTGDAFATAWPNIL